MFNKRVFLFLFILIIGMGTISSVSAADMDGSNNDTMKIDDSMDVSEDLSQISEMDVESDEALSASDSDVLQDNTNGRPISQLKGLIDQTASGGTLSLKFDYYCTSDDARAGIVINKPITINGDGHTIDANDYCRIFNIVSDGVIINDLTFTHGYYYNSNEYFLGHGACIYIEEGTTTFNNCNFYNNTAECNGGVIFTCSGLIANKCNFIDNNANGMAKQDSTMGRQDVYGWGGAIYALSPEGRNMEMRITDCTFANNNARAGGAIYIDYSTKDFNNRNIPYALKTIIKNCDFYNNYALYGAGVIYNCRDLDISDSRFQDNVADGSGGVIVIENGNGIKENMYYCFYPVNLEIHGNTVFSNNKAKYSGGVLHHGDGRVDIYPGVNDNDPIGTVKIYGNTIFEGNSAGNDGGVLCIPNIESSVRDATFINNVATTGGAMYGGTAIDCTFSGNSNPQTHDTILMSSSKLNVKQTGSTWKDKVVTATLNDGKTGSAIVNQYVTFNINGKQTNLLTNALGQVSIPVNLASGNHVVSISYGGNSKYVATSTKVNVNVLKVASKFSASKKTFKLKIKTKKYTVTLKDNSGNAIKNAKLTINVKGKTYKATTNSNGKATFKITKLNKKGNFNAKVKFAGNSYYNAVSKSVKISVKK